MKSTDFFVPFFIIRRLFLLVGQCGNDILSRCPDLAPRRIAEQPPYLRAFSTVIRQLHNCLLFFQIRHFMAFQAFQQSGYRGHRTICVNYGTLESLLNCRWIKGFIGNFSYMHKSKRHATITNITFTSDYHLNGSNRIKG